MFAFIGFVTVIVVIGAYLYYRKHKTEWDDAVRLILRKDK